jgi:hypothetical protein
MPSMPSEALLDVNVVIACVFADRLVHLPAREFCSWTVLIPVEEIATTSATTSQL